MSVSKQSLFIWVSSKSRGLTTGNFLKDPNNEKFSKINLQNNAYITRVGNVIGGNVILKEAGFVEEEGFLVMKNTDMARIADFVANIEQTLATRG